MINLVPPTARTQIRTEYWVRVVSVWALVVAGSLVIVALLLLPPYVLVSSQESVYADSAAAARGEVAAADEAEAALQAANSQSQRVISAQQQPRFLPVLSRIEAMTPPAVALREFRFRRSESGGVAPVSVTGVAATRQALADFRDTLEADPGIERVDLPISNLANDRDLTFSITIHLRTEDAAS